MSNYCVVLSTFSSEQQAQPVLDTIVKEKLAACIQSFPITSCYFWEGDICHEREILVLFKTTMDLYSSIEKRLKQLHPYETPEIICVPISDGSHEYLEWIKNVTK